MKETKCVWKERRRELVRCWGSKSEQLFKDLLIETKQNKNKKKQAVKSLYSVQRTWRIYWKK